MMANDGEKVKAYVEVVAAYVRQDLTLRQQKSAFDTALAFATQHLFRDQLNPAECGNSGLSNERCVVSTYWEYVRLMDKFLANVESRGGYVPKNGPRFELITTALKAAQAIGEFASLAQDFRRYGAPDRLFKLVDDAAAIKERDARSGDDGSAAASRALLPSKPAEYAAKVFVRGQAAGDDPEVADWHRIQSAPSVKSVKDVVRQAYNRSKFFPKAGRVGGAEKDEVVWLASVREGGGGKSQIKVFSRPASANTRAVLTLLGEGSTIKTDADSLLDIFEKYRAGGRAVGRKKSAADKAASTSSKSGAKVEKTTKKSRAAAGSKQDEEAAPQRQRANAQPAKTRKRAEGKDDEKARQGGKQRSTRLGHDDDDGATRVRKPSRTQDETGRRRVAVRGAEVGEEKQKLRRAGAKEKEAGMEKKTDIRVRPSAPERLAAGRGRASVDRDAGSGGESDRVGASESGSGSESETAAESGSEMEREKEVEEKSNARTRTQRSTRERKRAGSEEEDKEDVVGDDDDADRLEDERLGAGDEETQADRDFIVEDNSEAEQAALDFYNRYQIRSRTSSS